MALRTTHVLRTSKWPLRTSVGPSVVMSIACPVLRALRSPGSHPDESLLLTMTRSPRMGCLMARHFGSLASTSGSVPARPGAAPLRSRHGQPHPDLHPHRRPRGDPARRHEHHLQDRPAAGGVRRRRRGQRAVGVALAQGGLDEDVVAVLTTSRTTSSTSGPTSARRWWPTRSSRRCGSSRSTSTGSRRGATSTTSTCRTLRSFILNGGTPGAALLHVARTVVRRAERSAWAAYAEHADTMNLLAITYLNRLCDLLFILARYANREQGDVLWVPGGER